MTRVLLVMDGTGTGGAENSMAAIAPFLRAYGIEIEVAYFYERSGARETFQKYGVPLWHVAPSTSRLLLVWRLRCLIRKVQPDLVHTMVFESDIIGRMAAILARVPVMSSIISDIYCKDFMELAPSWLKARLGQTLDALTAQVVVGFHAVSQHTASQVPPRLCAGRKPVSIIYRGRDLASLAPLKDHQVLAVRESLHLRKDEKLVLLVARHAPPKGINTAIESLRYCLTEMPELRLIIVGKSGIITDHLEEMVRLWGLEGKVILLGHRTDIPNLIGASDVVVCPSLWEGFPGAALEARLCGKPLVASDIPPLQELARITGRSGTVLFRTGDPKDLGLKLLSVLKSEPPNTTGDCDAWRRHFDLDACASQFAWMYSSIVSSSSRKWSDHGENTA